MKLYVLALAAALQVQSTILATGSSNIVETKMGTIAGYINTVDVFGTSKDVVRFLGVPYAVPPVGPRRLQKPELLTRLPESPYDATYQRHSCMQLKLEQSPGSGIPTSEDCLYLNIYSPVVKDPSLQKRPVMIWFHGGSFVVGSGIIYAGDNLAAFGDVIIVTVHYRLGVLGFFSTGDEHAPGNYGLWDQHTAIRWVHENIDAFGGDPDKVTLFGNSAGGASVIYQGMYPGNTGLFQRVIAQSGAIFAPWARTKDPLKCARYLAKLLDCEYQSTVELVACIRGKPLSEIERVYSDRHGFLKFPFDFSPSVDGELLQIYPDDLQIRGNFGQQSAQQALASIDVLAGFNSMEGGYLLSPFADLPDAEHLAMSKESFEKTWVPKILHSMYDKDVPEIIQNVVATEYTNWSHIDDTNARRKMFAELSSDYAFNMHVMRTAQLHASKATKRSTYLYYFDIDTTHSVFPNPSWVNGASHADELFLVFGYNKDLVEFFTPLRPIPDWEQVISKAMMTMWTNFAKSGNPNVPADVKQYMDVEWPVYIADTEKYLHIRRGQSYIGQRLKARATHFWLTTMPSLLETVCKTCPSDGPVNDQQYAGDVCFKDGTCEP